MNISFCIFTCFSVCVCGGGKSVGRGGGGEWGVWQWVVCYVGVCGGLLRRFTVTRCIIMFNQNLLCLHLFVSLFDCLSSIIYSKYFCVFVFRALSAGCKAPLLVHPQNDSYKYSTRVAALGALHGLYVVRLILNNSLLNLNSCVLLCSKCNRNLE